MACPYVGDVVREEVKSRGMEPEAKIMSFVAQDLRNEFGPSVIMERILPQVDEFIQVSHVVIEEYDRLRKWKGCNLRTPECW